jgi:hypothetical protein
VVLAKPLDDPRRVTGRYLRLSPALQDAIARAYTLCTDLDNAYVYTAHWDHDPGAPVSPCSSLRARAHR